MDKYYDAVDQSKSVVKYAYMQSPHYSLVLKAMPLTSVLGELGT
jgi:hypothetical protein